jgi:hypothetical protein
MASPGRRYSIDGQRAVSAAKTLLGLTGGTTIRPGIYDLFIGSSATPADNALLWYFQRSTAAGTSTAVTPSAIDSADPVAIATAGQNHSGEPTYTAGAILFHHALNQRASHRANIDPMAPLMVPATGSNGIGLYPSHASFTGNVDATIWYFE